jgi:excisionase family DNA binding protein
MQEFYSIKEVAVIFGCHPNTIRRALTKGYIKAIRLGEKKKSHYRISKATVEILHEYLGKR